MLCVLIGQENGKSRLEQTQEEVEEVKVIMLDNLNKAEERSGKLGELEDRADVLLEKVRRASSEKLSKWEKVEPLFLLSGSLWVVWIR